MTNNTRAAILRIALAGIVLATLATLTGTSSLTPTPAQAQVPSDAAVAATPRVTGLIEVEARSARDSRSPKTVVAQCPPGKQILGGAGYVDGAGDHDSRTILTQMRPTSDDSVYGYGYAVTAAETPPGGDQRFAVSATAFCADPLPGHHIVTQSTGSSSPPMQETAAACPAGQRVLGTGGEIDPVFVGVGYRNIGLQMVRAFGPGTNGVQAVRVQASELPVGYDHNWRLRAFVVCADTPDGYKVNTAVSELNGSEGFKIAALGCPSRRLVNHSAAVDTFASPGWGAPGNITILFTGVPLDNGTRVVEAIENTPTSLNWVVEAQAICIWNWHPPSTSPPPPPPTRPAPPPPPLCPPQLPNCQEP